MECRLDPDLINIICPHDVPFHFLTPPGQPPLALKSERVDPDLPIKKPLAVDSQTPRLPALNIYIYIYTLLNQFLPKLKKNNFFTLRFMNGRYIYQLQRSMLYSALSRQTIRMTQLHDPNVQPLVILRVTNERYIPVSSI